MIAVLNPVRASLNRQVNHWLQAVSRLSALDHLVSMIGWQGIENNMGKTLRESLQKSIAKVLSNANQLHEDFHRSESENSLKIIKQRVTALREEYLKTEQTIHFYTIALNSRTTANVSALLRACDALCLRSMEQILIPLGKKVPFVLTYIDKGIGASILKAGLRLWDGNISPVAAIKITQHNLFRPTAIIHETGHQVAHILDWNEELANWLRLNLSNHPNVVTHAFANWSSEIAADAFAFVHTGFGSVAALHDVVSGSPESVFAFHSNDPHPISYVRVLMGLEMCRQFYGQGPWDELEIAFKEDYNINSYNYSSISLIKMCIAALPEVVSMVLKTSYRSFNNQALTQLIPPERVSPKALEKLEYIAGPALFTSHAWIWKECIKLLALIGYKIGVGEQELAPLYKLQEEWMIKLGFAIDFN